MLRRRRSPCASWTRPAGPRRTSLSAWPCSRWRSPAATAAPIPAPARTAGCCRPPRPNPDYFLFGGTRAHPSEDGDAGTSHFVAPNVLPKLAAVAAEFHKSTGMPLRVNDSSLPWGGVFDIAGGWARPHYNHRDGTDVDIAIFKYGADWETRGHGDAETRGQGDTGTGG